MAPDTFPCQAWYMPSPTEVVEVTLYQWSNQRVKQWFYTSKQMIHSGRVFNTALEAVTAEIEKTNTECQRLRKLLSAAEEARTDAILLQAEISQKNNSKV